VALEGGLSHVADGEDDVDRRNRVRGDHRRREDLRARCDDSPVRQGGEAAKAAFEGAVRTSHVISKAEAKFVFEKGCELLIVGTGQDGNVSLSPEGSAYFSKKDCRVVLQRTPEAVLTFNRSRDRKAALMHVTC
jgi:hypothetical protein